MRKFIAIFITSIILSQVFFIFDAYAEENMIENTFLSVNSVRNTIEDIIVIASNNPLFGIIGSYVSCWYNSEEEYGLKPMIVHDNGQFTDLQKLFFDQYFAEKNGSILVLGEQVQTDYETNEILGTATDVSIETATYIYSSASTIIIIPNDMEDYQLSLTAGPLASYLDVPILIFENNTNEILTVCNDLNATDAIIIGDIQLDLPDINITTLETSTDIQNMILSTINSKFGKINYITLTNPSDTIPSYIISSNTTTISEHISNVKITFLSREFDIKGRDSKEFAINVSEGINRIQIYGNITSIKPNFVDPIIFISLYDPIDNLVAYSSSLAFDVGSAYLETLITNASGEYTLVAKIYNGIKGGFFSQRGISIVDSDFDISYSISNLEKTHLPYIPNLSITASYLTAAHGGIILADSQFELTDESYAEAADGYSSGPWHNEKLHNFTNEKVWYVVDQINNTLDMIDEFEMLNDYLEGPAWLAILAGTNMIPMYYYSPSQPDLLEKGLPSDNPYSLNWNLSVSRVIGWNVEDVSLMIAKTLFYEDICKLPTEENNWHNKFNFIFGEGFGETGGIFHQIPYSRKIREYGFDSEVFGDLRNGRKYAELFKVYTGSNYIEYLGHGDWFWFSPSLYGFDMYSKAIDVAHAKEWIYEKPSIFLTSSCLMGRIDGILPMNNIGLTMLHAGCNAFIGATRETGQEAGLTILENHLIIDDFSIGEALQGEKKVDKEPPTYYVRVLYGDPAFNPYEPNNGFSNQGRPFLLE